MSRLHNRFGTSLSLLTDLYQLTMASGYLKLGREEEQAAFHLTFRKCPFDGGYALTAGLVDAIDWLTSATFDEDDLAYLRSLRGADRNQIFPEHILDKWRDFRFTVDVDAIPEGTVVFPHEPLVRVSGPLWQCQLAETAVLNIINFQTLIATKAARICQAAAGDPVVDFGLRRAQGIDGSLSASRAAYLGGCAATSNVLAGKTFNIPVRGTHAHSWVMSFDTELQAFEAFAEVAPGNSSLLVDTYNTLDGVRNAARVGVTLKSRGRKLLGIRLDSGDLAYLSIEARKILDAAGLTDASIVASNDLDEHIIADLKRQGAKIDTWGVGTKLITGHNQPALGGVYKLGARRATPDAPWTRTLKLSEQSAKVSIPGILQVRRFRDSSGFIADAIYDAELGCPDSGSIVDPADPIRRRDIPATASEDLLVPVLRQGRPVSPLASLEDARARAANQLASLHPGIKRLMNPHAYPAGLEQRLFDLRYSMTLAAKARHAESIS
jgi:nicotinate phosphoribosyltransferase